MTDDKLKEVIELFARSLMAIGRAITYDEQNKSQALNRIIESDKYLSNIIDIISE
jgi:Mg2+ and Co2+ transporter CorA